MAGGAVPVRRRRRRLREVQPRRPLQPHLGDVYVDGLPIVVHGGGAELGGRHLYENHGARRGDVRGIGERRRRHGDRVATPQRESSPTPRPTPTTSTTQSCPKPVQHNHSHVNRRPGPRGTSRRKPHGKPQAPACTQPPAVHKLCASLQFRQAEQSSGERGWRIGSQRP